jgi:multisubunit Na+/H+ antiporter MnhG subunit
MILLFSFLAGTTASHAMAKAALKSGLKPWEAGSEESQSGEKPSKP